MQRRQRATAAHEKQERREAILDAAEKLFVRHPDRVASVSEVAQAAGLAKGTVYLYFGGKEEMLLALHERQMQEFFDRFMQAAEGARRVGFDDILAIARAHFVAAPGRLALASRCLALMDRELPLEAGVAFKLRVGARVAAAGAALERHFPTLGAGAGARLLQHSMSMMVGLWQFIHPNQRMGKALEKHGMHGYLRDYDREIDAALRALWSGTISPARAARALR